MTDTVRLGLPLLAAAQAQKHVTHNEALLIIDAVVQLSVIDSEHTSPPETVVDGDRYRVASGATGEWSAWDLNIALKLDGEWRKLVPKSGWICWDETAQLLSVWTGSGWTDFGGTLGFLTTGAVADGSLSRIGILTAADATNRLAVKTDTALFSHDDVTPGSGDLRLTLNKSAAARDAGFVFQDGWSTRALFGLLGDDDFTVKVTPDGSSFFTGLVVRKGDGRVDHVRGAKFSAYLNYGQDYAAGAWRDLLFNNFRHNDQGAAAIVSNVLTFTAPTAGVYLFGLSATYEAGSAPSKMQVGLSVSGATPTADTLGTTGDATFVSGETQCRTTALLSLAAGATVGPKIWFTGANGRVLGNENVFWGVRIA
ncbi:hypothetical protein A33M_0412 [Rhodovulum sp. PH10]|uniref:DUF2793 domain-containing protein n=1 Tax=Rhodovulum sp. PH10 TaxID=1187851 RepID=UPI00027C26E3|nr:DUF2793 domain-containing protein [Rhodovulum sp. PH10]EJW10163.1 hypothetical protein A33M_0412 [Rhodovulum sp. PH10]